MQPAQQQGRRMPSMSSVRTRCMCSLLVSDFLTDITQQIHSFLASGVMSSHAVNAFLSEVREARKSAGSLWTVPGEIFSLVEVSIFVNYFSMNWDMILGQ